MNILEAITKSTEGRNHEQKVKMDVLKYLGYICNRGRINIKRSNKENVGFVIYEVVDIDTPERKVGFSFLYSNKMKMGVILPQPFSFYGNCNLG